MTWTIDQELLKISGQATLEEGLIALGITPQGEGFARLDGGETWIRGGAETYVYPFSVVFDSGRSEHFIEKAVVAFSFANSLDGILAEWVRRRTLIQNAGVRVPRLIFAGQGVIIESFISLSLIDAVRDGIANIEVLGEVFYYAGVLSRFRFDPVNAFCDLRTDGSHMYVIDFGEDLGPAGAAESMPIDLYKKLVDWLDEHFSDHNWRLEEFRTLYSLGKGG